MEQNQLANVTKELVKYKPWVNETQVSEASVATKLSPATVRRYLKGEAKKLPAAAGLLEWLQANITIRVPVTTAEAA